MTRLSELTARLKREGRKPIVPFLTAGYPDRATFRGVMEAAAEVGCPLVEIGFPFSDPVADGPVIQAASMQALAQGMSLKGTIELAAEVGRDFDLTVVIMGYLNPILTMGADRFARACGEAGVAGVIVPDLPLEEADALRRVLRGHDAELVDLVAPTTGEDRMTDHRDAAGGFLYLVSTTGVTGAGSGSDDDLESYVARVRAASPLPLYVGFGIAEPRQAARVAGCADGAVVGSALIRVIDEAGSGPAAVEAARRFLTEMTAAMADPNAVQAPERNEA
jgi:tryptophan synthase alpha chain